MQLGIRGGAGGISGAGGGIAVYPQQRLYEELAFMAYYLHWPYNDILNLEHPERLRWVKEISGINQRLNGK